MTENRIFFQDNPYPLGHEIIEFVWSGRLDEDGEFYFDFHLKTEDYYAGDPITEDEPTEEELDADDWHSKIVWGNYHACTMSSTFWGSDGIMIDKSKPKFNFANWPNTSLTADTLTPDALNSNLVMPADLEWDDLALNIYLLGHDACANHQIDITQTSATFNIAWTGKIALAYAGEDEFKYDFNANISEVKFDGFDYPQTLSQAQARENFAKIIANLDDFEFVDLNPKSNKREYKFALKIKT
jgi:hypothetical protein